MKRLLSPAKLCILSVAIATLFLATSELEGPAKPGYRAQAFYFQTKPSLTADQQRLFEEFTEKFRVTVIGITKGPYRVALANDVKGLSSLELVQAFIATEAVDVMIPRRNQEPADNATASMTIKK